MNVLKISNTSTAVIDSPFNSEMNYCCVVTGATEQVRRRRLISMADNSLNPDTLLWAITDGRGYSSDITEQSGVYVDLNSEYNNLNPLHLIKNDDFYAPVLATNAIVSYLLSIIKETADSNHDISLESAIIRTLINRCLNDSVNNNVHNSFESMQADFISAVTAISDKSSNYGLEISPVVINAFKLFITSPLMDILKSPPSDLDRKFSSFTVFDLKKVPIPEKHLIFNIMLIHSISNMYLKNRALRKLLIVDESVNPLLNEDIQEHDFYARDLEYAIRACRLLYGGIGFSYPAMSLIPPTIFQNVSTGYVIE